MEEKFFVSKYMIRSTSRELSHDREQSRAEALKHQPSLGPRWCSQLCAPGSMLPAPCSWVCSVLPAPCSWLRAPGSVLLDLFCTPGSLLLGLFCAPDSLLLAPCPWVCSMLPAPCSVLLALCAQVHVPSSVLCSWLPAPSSVLPALCSWLFASGSVCPALCAWESRMAGCKGAAVLLKGLTENKPFHKMDETLLKRLSLVF